MKKTAIALMSLLVFLLLFTICAVGFWLGGIAWGETRDFNAGAAFFVSIMAGFLGFFGTLESLKE